MAFTTYVKMLNGVVATTTSDGIDVSDRLKLSLQFVCDAYTSNQGIFTVEVSNDGGTTWKAYSRLTSNSANTNVQTDTRVASVTLSATGSEFVFFPIGDHFGMIRVVCTVTATGTYSCYLRAISSTI